MELTHDKLVAECKKFRGRGRHMYHASSHNATSEEFMMTLHQGSHSSPSRKEMYEKHTDELSSYLQDIDQDNWGSVYTTRPLRDVAELVRVKLEELAGDDDITGLYHSNKKGFISYDDFMQSVVATSSGLSKADLHALTMRLDGGRNIGLLRADDVCHRLREIANEAGPDEEAQLDDQDSGDSSESDEEDVGGEGRAGYWADGKARFGLTPAISPSKKGGNLYDALLSHRKGGNESGKKECMNLQSYLATRGGAHNAEQSGWVGGATASTSKDGTSTTQPPQSSLKDYTKLMAYMQATKSAKARRNAANFPASPSDKGFSFFDDDPQTGGVDEVEGSNVDRHDEHIQYTLGDARVDGLENSLAVQLEGRYYFLRSALNKKDQSRSGAVNEAEFLHAVTDSGVSLQRKEVKHLFDRYAEPVRGPSTNASSPLVGSGATLVVSDKMVDIETFVGCLENRFNSPAMEHLSDLTHSELSRREADIRVKKKIMRATGESGGDSEMAGRLFMGLRSADDLEDGLTVHQLQEGLSHLGVDVSVRQLSEVVKSSGAVDKDGVINERLLSRAIGREVEEYDREKATLAKAEVDRNPRYSSTFSQTPQNKVREQVACNELSLVPSSFSVDRSRAYRREGLLWSKLVTHLVSNKEGVVSALKRASFLGGEKGPRPTTVVDADAIINYLSLAGVRLASDDTKLLKRKLFRKRLSLTDGSDEGQQELYIDTKAHVDTAAKMSISPHQMRRRREISRTRSSKSKTRTRSGQEPVKVCVTVRDFLDTLGLHMGESVHKNNATISARDLEFRIKMGDGTDVNDIVGGRGRSCSPTFRETLTAARQRGAMEHISRRLGTMRRKGYPVSDSIIKDVVAMHREHEPSAPEDVQDRDPAPYAYVEDADKSGMDSNVPVEVDASRDSHDVLIDIATRSEKRTMRDEGSAVDVGRETGGVSPVARESGPMLQTDNANAKSDDVRRMLHSAGPVNAPGMTHMHIFPKSNRATGRERLKAAPMFTRSQRHEGSSFEAPGENHRTKRSYHKFHANAMQPRAMKSNISGTAPKVSTPSPARAKQNKRDVRAAAIAHRMQYGTPSRRQTESVSYMPGMSSSIGLGGVGYSGSGSVQRGPKTTVAKLAYAAVNATPVVDDDAFSCFDSSKKRRQSMASPMLSPVPTNSSFTSSAGARQLCYTLGSPERRASLAARATPRAKTMVFPEGPGTVPEETEMDTVAAATISKPSLQYAKVIVPRGTLRGGGIGKHPPSSFTASATSISSSASASASATATGFSLVDDDGLPRRVPPPIPDSAAPVSGPDSNNNVSSKTVK